MVVAVVVCVVIITSLMMCVEVIIQSCVWTVFFVFWYRSAFIYKIGHM